MIEVNNLTDFDIKEKKIKEITEKVLREENQKELNLSIAFKI